MRVRPGFGETLPALLRRRRGVPERTTLVGFGVVVLLGLVAFLLLRDPLDGRTQRVHRSAPVFNTLYLEGLVEPVAPRGREYQRYEARHRGIRLELSIRPVRLPAYRGNVSGALPVFAERHLRGLRASLPGFQLVQEGRARVNKAPGYEVGFAYDPPGGPRLRATGQDVVVVPEEVGSRDGVVISLRHVQPRGRTGAGGRKVVKAMRSAFRSFKYGADRDD